MKQRITGNEPVIVRRSPSGAEIRYERSEDGVYYHADTPLGVRTILDRVRRNARRVRVFYGDTEGPTTGRAWLDESHIIGTIGCSMGPMRIPLLVANARSTGGSPLLDSCVIRLIDVTSKEELYRHPAYEAPILKIMPEPTCPEPYVASVYRLEDGRWNIQARFKKKQRADNWINFMLGDRMAA